MVYEKRETKPKKLFKYLDKTKVDEMLERARADNKRNYLIIMTFWRTGMRNSDIRLITKRDVKLDQITIRQGKGHKDRIIPIDNTLADLLMYHSANMAMDDLLFPYSDMTFRNITHKYQGDESVHPHKLRHSFAVFYLKSGGNLRSLQKILGHTSLETTDIYLDLIAEDIKDDYKKLKF